MQQVLVAHTEICDLGHGQGVADLENMIRKARALRL